MREIIESARYKPILARMKVFIIDEVHMLSKSAFNGLLKTLEEPPEHVKFIFATTEIRRVPSRSVAMPAVRSAPGRCAGTLGSSRQDYRAGGSHRRSGSAGHDRAVGGRQRSRRTVHSRSGIATGSGHVSGDVVRGMLGLADRGRVLQCSIFWRSCSAAPRRRR